MKIQNQPNYIQNNSGRPPQKPDPEQTMVERIVDKTYLGANYTASGIAGTVGGLGAYGRSVIPAFAKTTASFYKNLVKAETLGPNIKVIGGVLAAPVLVAGAVLGLPVSAGAGLYQGCDEVDSTKPRQFTIPSAAREGYSKTRGGWESLTDSAIKGLEEFGNEKLAEGEKPFDIPLLKTGKAVVAGAVGAVIGGAAGLAAAVVGTAREAVVGVYKSFADDELHIGGKLLGSAGAVLGAPVHGVVYGATTAIGTTARAIGETWKQDSLVGGVGGALKRGAVSVGAALAPESVLLEEKQNPPQ